MPRMGVNSLIHSRKTDCFAKRTTDALFPPTDPLRRRQSVVGRPLAHGPITSNTHAAPLVCSKR